MDKDNRENKMLVFKHRGEIWCEVQCRHNGVEVFSAFRLGQSWEVLPRLAGLL